MAELALSRTSGCSGRATTARRSKAGCSRPAGYDAAKGPYPLIVVSHGGPHAATGYASISRSSSSRRNGYFVLDTNFRSSTGYGDAFKWATWGEWGEKDGEDVDVRHRRRHQELSDRSEARRPHRPLLRRVHDELADHAVPRSLRRGDHRRRHHELDQRLRHRPTSTAPRRRSSSARRGTEARATG